MDKLSFDNPLFATYVIAATLLILKAAAMSWLVVFRMIRENGGWRIDDIINSFEGKDYSVREVLSQPYDCGSFMGKPCKR